jgi:hypothetical protein
MIIRRSCVEVKGREVNTADKDACAQDVRSEKWEEEYQQDNENRRVRMGKR